MQIVTIPDALQLRPDERIEPGEYLSDNLLGAQLINLCGDGAMRPMDELRPFDEKKDWNGKSILFMRAGGFGDIVNLTPTLREFKKRWPEAKIAVASMGEYGTVLKGLSYVDEIIKYPVTVKTTKSYDAWVLLEKAIEKNPRAEKIHMADLYAEVSGLTFGITKSLDGHPDYIVSEEERAWANVQYPRKPGIRRLCIQATASSSVRVYPFHRLDTVVNTLKADKEWEIFLMGMPGEIKMQDTENVKNIANAGLKFRQSAAVVAASDILLGNDSSLVHVAGALGLPAVALYGPFPWKLRTAYSPSIRALQGNGRCAPCFFHQNPGQLNREEFPAECPSKAKGYCEVLESIKPEKIVAAIKKYARAMPLTAVS